MKKTFFLSLVLCIFLINHISFAQTNRITPYCGVSDDRKATSFEDNISKIIELNLATENTGGRLINSNGLIVIPVVFHILYYPGASTQIIPNWSLESQLVSVNQDLTRTNPLTGIPTVWQNMPGNMNVRLKLACKDPNGNPTDGIIRKPLASPTVFPQLSGPGQFGIFPEAQLSSMGGDDAWPTDKYLNIWIADFAIMGWGMRPSERFESSTFVDNNGNTVTQPNSKFDGIVLDYSCFANDFEEPLMDLDYRMITHEVGHWLGLEHVFAGCLPGDYVDDTPPQNINHWGLCPTTAQFDDCTPFSPGSPGTMYMDFMDYTISRCMRFFTVGQVQRVRNFYFNENNAGYYGNRGPFINNYFGIKEPFTLQNNTLTVYLNNPACLDVNYSFTGPVTEISHDNQKIVFSVPCPSAGNVTVTATAGNYVDDYSFTFSNFGCSDSWPKVYEWGMKFIGSLNKDKFGNIFYSFYSDNMQNNLNHYGASSPNINSFFTTQYNQTTGYTNWIKPDYFLGTCLGNSDIRLSENTAPSPIFSHFNSTSGVPVANNTTLTNTESLLVETALGEYLTYDWNSNVFRFHPTNGQPVTLPYLIQTFFYSPITSKLYTRSIHTSGNSGQAYFDVYDITNGTVTLAHSTIQTTNWGLINLDNSENLYVVNNTTNNAYLEKYDYLTNTFTPLAISNFNNSNLITLPTPNYYPSDFLLVYNKNDHKLYSLNFNTNTAKSMTTSNIENYPTGGALSNYIYVGNDLFLSGVIYDNQNITLGSQTISPLSSSSNNHFNSNFLTKFNLLDDFSSRNGSYQYKKPGVNYVESVVKLFPNPSCVTIKLIVDEKDKNKVFNYSIIILDQMKNILRKIDNYKLGSDIDISDLQKGVYYVELVNYQGKKIGKVFSKF